MNTEQYRKDGFTVLRGAVYMPMTELIERRLRELYAQSKDDYLRYARLLSKTFWAMRLCADLEICRVVQELGVRHPVFLTNPAIHVMGVDYEFDGVGAHQDWPALQSGLNTVVVWIPLTDVTLENYPVELAPGSHLRGLLPAIPGAHYSAADTEGMEFVPVTMNRGDVLLFSVFTVHRTRIPGSGFRLALSHRYEDAEDPWFKQHGNYSAQSRVIEREVKWTPSAEQVKAVFA
jgi:ectoine hydroxylase-related dioxygenase (phytanoyl-CoA dioxygenase family)